MANLRKPKNASFGVFPSSSAVRSVSSTDLGKVYFSTQNRRHFSWESGTMPEEDRTENFDQIHSMGKKNTKYMKFQPSKAPLVDRTACKYNQEFTEKPLGDCVTNKALAENFKQGGMSRNMSSPFLGLKSSYMENHCGFDDKGMKSAKQKSCKPRAARTETLGGTGDMLETVCCSHSDLRAPPLALAKPGEVLLPKPNLTLAGTNSTNGLFRSQHKRDFINPSTHEARIPAHHRTQPNFPTLPQEVIDDETAFHVRRACFLSPGQ
jgi:hypothetical protein